ncbi:MAG: pyridoxal phosphate-dependent aminotransferase [Thermoanaerobaculales bacterium]
MGAVGRVRTALAAHQGPRFAWLVGEPCFPPPEVLREALVRAARTRRFDYAPPAGLPLLREILAARHQGPSSPVGADQVVVTTGAKAGLLAVLAAILEPGDELIHPLPCYPAYPAMAARIGARPVGVSESNGSFEGWADRVGEAIGPRTRAVVLASPSNPTGATLDLAQARALVRLCRDRGVRLICDEAYADFPLRPGRDGHPAQLDPRHETVVQVRSVSKSWALCDWRIGWIVADTPLAARVAEVHAGLMNPAPGPAQEALLALPEVPESYTAGARDTIAERMSEVCAVLEAGGATIDRPEGGFYLWLDVRSPAGERGNGIVTPWCVELAGDHGVGLWPGEDFHGNGRVRLAVTAPADEDWAHSLEALARAMQPPD